MEQEEIYQFSREELPLSSSFLTFGLPDFPTFGLKPYFCRLFKTQSC